MFNGTVNLRKFHRMKPDKSYSKDLYFLCCKTLLNGYRTSPRSCLSMRWISNLSPFGNLSHDVFFSVDLFFRGRRPVNITGAVTGNPRFHQNLTVFKTPFRWQSRLLNDFFWLQILNGTLSVLVVFCYHNFSDDVIAYAEV